MVDNHIDIPYPISIIHIPHRNPYRYLIDVRSPISISHIDIGSSLVTLGRAFHSFPAHLNLMIFARQYMWAQSAMMTGDIKLAKETIVGP
jgi:hypothetical protein